MKVFLLLLIVFSSCRVTREDKESDNGDPNSIAFVVLSIRRDSAHANSIVELLSKTQSAGEIKDKNKNALEFANYLSIVIYNQGKILDSMTIEHPLFRHIEYLDDNNNFSVKDITLDKAEFFFRFQVRGSSNEIRILEKLRGSTKKELATIKL